MSTTPLVSIIIVSYNTKEILVDCLRSVRKQVVMAKQVIVIDNASPDHSADMVAREFPEFRLIANTENVGFSPANNQGMELATGKYILLLNPDTLVPAGSIDQWIADHERVGAGVSGPSLTGPDGMGQVSAWRIPHVLDAWLEAFFLHRLFRRTQYPADAFAKDVQVGFVSGAAMLFERKVFQRVGGLDPELFWMEDTDFCLRVSHAGGTCFRLHKPRIVHIGGQSSTKDPRRMISNQLISRVKFVRKHNGLVAGTLVALAVYFHVITRVLGSSVLGLFQRDPRAATYRYTFGKLSRYIFQNDRSI